MSLPSSFLGTPASVGARLGAFTIDVVLVAAVAVGAALISTPVLGIAVAAQAVLGLWMLQARFGAGPGAFALRLRVSRADAPFSPGAGRSFVRGSLLGLAGLVLVAGAWVVLASAAWDRSGRRRSWIDRAADTLVVALPPRGLGPDDEASYALATPTVLGRSGTADRVPAAALDASAPEAPVWGSPMPLPAGAATTAAPAAVTTATPEAASSQAIASAAAGAAPAASPVQPPAASVAIVATPSGVVPAPVPAPAPVAELLLVFDTGQRAQFALPAAVNLGRAPAPTEAGDELVAVDDPDRMVSKTHLRLEHDGESAWVTDAGSTNGSELVDEDGTGRVLAAGVRTPLEEGMRVRIGERIFTVSRLIGGPA